MDRRPRPKPARQAAGQPTRCGRQAVRSAEGHEGAQRAPRDARANQDMGIAEAGLSAGVYQIGRGVGCAGAAVSAVEQAGAECE